MASTIITKHGTGSAVPTRLSQGELAINVDSGSLYYGVKGGEAISSSFYVQHITASGNISSSGYLYATAIYSKGAYRLEDSGGTSRHIITENGNYLSIGNTNLSGIKITGSAEFYSHITASGEISASGHIYGHNFVSYGIHSIGYDSGGGGSVNIGPNLTTPVKIHGNITASGNISSSGAIRANTAEIVGGTTIGADLIIGRAISASHADAAHIIGGVSTTFMGDITASATGSFQHLVVSGDVSGNISASGYIYGDQYYSNGGGIAYDNGTTTFYGNNKLTEIDGTNITLDAPVTAAGDISASGNIGAATVNINGGNDASLTDGTGYLVVGDEQSTNIVFDNNEIQSRNDAAYSTLNLQADGGDFKLHSNTGGVFAISHDGDVTASGAISASGRIFGSQIRQNVDGVNQALIHGGTGSFLHLNMTGDISASEGNSIYGDAFHSKDHLLAQYHHNELYIGDPNESTHVSGTRIFLESTVTASGNISSSGGLIAKSLTLATDGTETISANEEGNLTVFAKVVAGGFVSSSAGLFGTILDLRTNGIRKAYIADGVGLFTGGIDAIEATGSFGYISASGDITAAGTIFASAITSSGEISGSEIIASSHFDSKTSSTGYKLSGVKVVYVDGTNYTFGRDATTVISGSTISLGNPGDPTHVTASGNISSSGTGLFEEITTASTGSFGHLYVNGTINIPVVGGTPAGLIQVNGVNYLAGTANDLNVGNTGKITDIRGTNVLITGSVSMSGALSMSGANAEIITEGGVYALGNISSSGLLSGTSLAIKSAGVAKTLIDVEGGITASNISSSGIITTNNINSGEPLTISGSATISGSLRPKGQLKIVVANWKDANDYGVDEIFIPLAGQPEEKTGFANDQTLLLMPCDGLVKEIICRTKLGTYVDTDITWKVYVRPKDKQVNGFTQTGGDITMTAPTQLATNNSNTVTTGDLGISHPYSQYDMLGISMEWGATGTVSGDKVYITVVLENDFTSIAY